MGQTKVSIIIVNWNGRQFLDECLSSLRRQTCADYEIIFVDNGSQDDSINFVQDNFSEVNILALDKNLGFTEGNIEGLKVAKGDYICLLNNDTRATSEWLKFLADVMDEYLEVGMCASKVIIDGTNIINSCGDGMTTAGMGYQIGRGEPIDRYTKKEYIFGGYGAAMMYRKKMLDEIGFFDDSFFMIYEEDDLSFRAQLAGWKCLYVPQAVVYHKVSASIKRTSTISVYHMARNIEWLWIKNMPTYFIFRYLHHKIIQELIEFCYFLFIGRLKAYLKGKIDAAITLPVTIKKRKEIQTNKRVSNKYLNNIISSMWPVVFLTIRRICKGR